MTTPGYTGFRKGKSHNPAGISSFVRNVLIESVEAKDLNPDLRSAKFAKTLNQRGYAHVFNLRGSIFEWANNGYPLKRGEQIVSVVHPYNKKWGSLVKKSLHAYHVQ